MKTLIEAIEVKLKSQDLLCLAKAKSDIRNSDSGFYWIYTKLPIGTFLECDRPINAVHVDFSLMAKVHKDVKGIIGQTDSDDWCIYNGKGKKLKERLSAAFTNTAGKTGKLALTRCFEEDEFRVKYIVCQSADQKYGITQAYSNVQRDLERVWRLSCGWPFLCRT